MTRYVIIGGSAGTVGAVEAIREVDPVGDITVISEEPNAAYSRPMIAEHLTREADLKKMAFPTTDFWNQQKVQTHLLKKAVKLNLAQQEVELEDNERIPYDRLLIATGGKPFVPKMEGVNKRGVYNFVNAHDAQRIGEAIEKDKVQKAVVIGGGLIGVSAAESLTKRCIKVTVIELKNWILNLVLDSDAAKIVEKAMQREDVSIITGRTVQRIMVGKGEDEAVGGVVLDDGTAIECDIVVVAVGVIPRTELAAQTDMKLNRGILVDRFMQTSVPNVYACGDVAEAYDFITQTNRVLALWPVARIGGRTAGYNMAGNRCEYPGATAMSALNYFGVPVISAGLSAADPSEGFETLLFQDKEKGVYRKVILKDGTVVGMTFVGDVERSGVVLNLMKNRIKVESFKRKLVSDDFTLASLPEILRKNILLGL